MEAAQNQRCGPAGKRQDPNMTTRDFCHLMLDSDAKAMCWGKNATNGAGETACPPCRFWTETRQDDALARQPLKTRGCFALTLQQVLPWSGIMVFTFVF